MTQNRTLLFSIAMVLTTLACTMFVGGPDFPEQPIPISTEAIESLKAQIETAIITGAESGVITLEISEEQLTSYIAFKMTSQEDPFFQDPQVYLRDGQMKIFGKVVRGNLTANMLIALTVSADDLGQPRIEILTADFGPFPAPEGLKQTITAIVTEAYTGSLGPVATGFRLEDTIIENGIMTVSGRIK